MKKTNSQKEVNQNSPRKRLRARIREYINKKSIGVNIPIKVVDEITDFFEDILIQYAKFLKESNAERIYNENMKYLQACGSSEPDKKKIQRIEKKSITLDQAVDTRHKILRGLISQNML